MRFHGRPIAAASYLVAVAMTAAACSSSVHSTTWSGSSASPRTTSGSDPLLPTGAVPEGLIEPGEESLEFHGLRFDARFAKTGTADYELHGSDSFAVHGISGDSWRQDAVKGCHGGKLVEQPDRFTVGSHKGHVYVRQGCDREAYFLEFPSSGVLIASYQNPAMIISLEWAHAKWSSGGTKPTLNGLSVLPDDVTSTKPLNIEEATFKNLSLTLVGQTAISDGPKTMTIQSGRVATVRLHDVTGVDWKAKVVSDCPGNTDEASSLVEAGTYAAGAKKGILYSRKDCSDEISPDPAYYLEFADADILIVSGQATDNWDISGAEWTS